MASPVLESSEEKIFGFKLMRLIVDGGTEALRNIFLTIHPGNNLHTVLAGNYLILYRLFNTNKVITQPQWDKLYPRAPKIPNINEFDITLLVILLRNICGLSSPSTGWNVMPISTDNSREANIVRIKFFRNNFFGHVSGTDVSRLDFEARWVEVSKALLGLGLSRTEIDSLKTEECGEDEVNRVRKEWNESDREIVREIAGVKKMLEEDRKLMHETLKEVKSSPKDIVSECLHWCDFEKEIQLLLERYTEGTREWVFQQVSTWLNNTNSDNRAFIISGQAGMGKSTIAGVICKRFSEHLGGCHFFQYDNDRYNTPKFLLQSLAWQLCSAFPKYKENLTHKLSGNKGKILDNINIKGLFSLLFEEPLANIPDPGKHFLIVIDALDECRQEEKDQLADLINGHFHKFPGFIRFLITTRSEKDIVRKFQALSPMFLERDDERNLNDLRLFFVDELKIVAKHAPSDKLVKTLVEKSEGLMLYASFLCKLTEDISIIPNIESLPAGIEEIYESYFKRLENGIRILGTDQENFLSFLSVLAVAKQPLPLALIEGLLTPEKDSSIAQRKLRKLINCVSSLFVIRDDCVSFFHKSVRDWLVKSNHDFTIIEKHGHKTLADICAYQMGTLKQDEVRFTYDLSMKYSLQYGIPHLLLAEMKDQHALTKMVDYVTDLEIVHASLCIDVYKTLSNLSSLESHNMYKTLREKTQATIKRLIGIIRKYTSILKVAAQSFFQHVLNENSEELSPTASALLMTRYREFAYFQSMEEEGSTEKAAIGRILTTGSILDVDISPAEDFLVCECSGGGIELFSLFDFKCLWKIDNCLPGFQGCIQSKNTCRRVVFHPFKNVIFPGRLDRVLNLEGKFESGPFNVDQTSAKFTNSCFSHDKNKMVTNCDNNLTVWNLVDNSKIISLSCRSLSSILFSANDNFFATTDSDELCVYDTENSYSMISRPNGEKFLPILYSTCNSDSWYCEAAFGFENEIVKCDLTTKRVSKHFPALPMNARAVAFIESHDDLSCLDKIRFSNLFILGNLSALFFRWGTTQIELVRLTELIPDSKPTLKSAHYRIERCSISVNGKYVYSQGEKFLECRRERTSATSVSLENVYSQDEKLYVSMRSCTQCVKSSKLIQVKDIDAPFVPVTNGVFFLGEVGEKHGEGNRSDGECIRGAPELWDSEVTQRLFSFPDLTGTRHCLSVADDLIACVMESQVCFFDVLKKGIVARTPLPKRSFTSETDNLRVIACSSQYDVLIGRFYELLLLQAENIIVLDTHVLDNTGYLMNACFSPKGRFLACFIPGLVVIFSVDILPFKITFETSLYSCPLHAQFVDEEHLIYAKRKSLCLMNVKTGNVLTSIPSFSNESVGKFSVSLKTGIIVLYGLYGYEETKL